MRRGLYLGAILLCVGTAILATALGRSKSRTVRGHAMSVRTITYGVITGTFDVKLSKGTRAVFLAAEKAGRHPTATYCTVASGSKLKCAPRPATKP